MKRTRTPLLDGSDDVSIEMALIGLCIAVGIAALAYLAIG